MVWRTPSQPFCSHWGSYDHCLSPQSTIAYHSLLRELVILLGTYEGSRRSSTTYVVLRMSTYLVGCMPCALENFFCTRVLVYSGLYIKVPAHVRERNNTACTIITTLRPVYFSTSRFKRSINSFVRSQVARSISLESSHHPSHTGQEMESIGHVVPKLLHFK